MSDLISRKEAKDAIYESFAPYQSAWAEKIRQVWNAIDSVPAVESPTWIPCSEGLPEERESIFKKAKGTDKWSPAMFEGISNNVNVTVEFKNGTRKTMTSHTTDGRWRCEREYGIKGKVVAWMPLPEPYKGDKNE